MFFTSFVDHYIEQNLFYLFRSIYWEIFYKPSKHINVQSTLKQRWSSTFINVVSTLIFGWKWKLSRRTFINVVSTLTKQRWKNADRITSIQRRWTNVVSTLKFDWKWKLSRRMFKAESTHAHRCWENSVQTTLSIERLRFTKKCLNNKAKLSFQV